MASKLWISVVLGVTTLGLPLASFAQYGNYGGGGGGGSFSTTTTTGGGDGSTGTNDTGNNNTDIETTIGLPPVSTDTGSGANEDYSWIPPRKADIETEVGVRPYIVVKLPVGYERVQLRIDALLFRVASMPTAERQKKAIALANAIQNIKQTPLWNNPRIKLLLQYLQDRLVMLITLPL